MRQLRDSHSKQVRQGWGRGWWDRSRAGAGATGGAAARLARAASFALEGLEGRILYAASIVGRYAFYNHSAFDGNSAAVNAADDAAVAVDKVALRPGQTASSSNYTSYARGLNGIMIDVQGLPAGAGPTAADFAFRVGADNSPGAWPAPAAPASVSVRRGAGTGGSDRVTLSFPDNAVKRTWLQASVLPTAATGLTSADVFYFGNFPGETLDDPGVIRVNALDLVRVRNNVRRPVGITSAFDFNRDKRVDATDLRLVRSTRFSANRLAAPGDIIAVQEVSPSAGEEMVGLERETIVRFTGRVDPSTVNDDSFFLTANGVRVGGRVQVSSTERFATIFYDNALPASTSVRVTVDGGRIRGHDGKGVDADGDGLPGGVMTSDFRTLPLTRIAGTAVWGYVYDSYNKNPDGTDKPVVGATIRVDAFAGADAVTDSTGYFELRDMPAPEFFVHIDGTTATNAPSGTMYPSVGKPFHSVPGQRTQLVMDGTPFHVYLPPMAMADVVTLSPTQDTPVGFGAAGKAELRQMLPDVDPSVWDRLKITYPPGSATDDQGRPATEAVVIPVPPDRLPAPLPPGAEPRLVFSVQAGGATNFDVPAPITYPNLDHLPAGSKASFMSFNHDAGKWQFIGLGTVSDDGLTIVADDGVGIRAPGWHFAGPPPQGPPGPPPPPPPPPPNCDTAGLAKCLQRSREDAIRHIAYCGAAAAAGIAACFLAGPGFPVCAGGVLVAQALCEAAVIHDQIVTDRRCYEDFCPQQGAGATMSLPEYNAVFSSLKVQAAAAVQTNAIAEQLIALTKQISDLAYPYAMAGQVLPQNVINQISALYAQMNTAAGGDGVAYLQNYALGLERQAVPLDSEIGEAPPYPIKYVAEIMRSNGEILFVRGDTEANGQYQLFAPNGAKIQLVSFYDPKTNRYGRAFPHLSPEAQFRFPRFSLLPVDSTFPDHDGDGLADAVEQVYGTNTGAADSDRDGISDKSEIDQRLDPLSGRAFPTGVIATLPLSGSANEVVVEATPSGGSRAYVATGSQGLAVVDASVFNNPVILGQLNLPGNATDVSVDPALNIAAVASNAGGLHLVDVSDPVAPVLIRTINVLAQQVDVIDGVAYVGVGNQLRSFDLRSGDLLQSLPAVGNTINGIAHEGTMLFTMDASLVLRSVDVSGPAMVARGSLAMSEGGGKLTVGNGIAYVAAPVSGRGGFSTVDVSDPANLQLISRPDVASPFVAPQTAIAVNGSGLGVLVGSNGANALDVMDLADPQNTNGFLARISLANAPLGVAIAGGIAFLATGSSGLQVVNYLSFDNRGTAPTVNIPTAGLDLDTAKPGVQVQEGKSLSLRANIGDDVQVRAVDLLVDGQVVRSDISFPFDLSMVLPVISPTKSSASVQVRATDTGGNVGLSAPLTLLLVEDTFAPTLVGTTPAAGARPKDLSFITVAFSEALDPSKLSSSGVTLTDLGADGVPGGGDDSNVPLAPLVLRNQDSSLAVYPVDPLPPGKYRLQVSASVIADRAGNALAAPITLDFTKRPLTTALTLGEVVAGSLEAGDDEVYTFAGSAGQRLWYDGLQRDPDSINVRLVAPNGELHEINGDTDGNAAPAALPMTGTYRLVFTAPVGAGGDYRFRLFDAAAQPAVTTGAPLVGTLDPGIQSNVYRFAARAGQHLYFDNRPATFDGSDGRSGWSLHGLDNRYAGVFGYFVNNPDNTDFEYTVPTTGEYLIHVGGEDAAKPLPFNMRVLDFAVDSTPLAPGAETSGVLNPGSSTVIYRFNGSAGQRLYFDSLQRDSDSIFAHFVGPDGNLTGEFDSNNDLAPVTLPRSGEYYLVLRGRQTAAADYRFRLVDAQAQPALPMNAVVQATLDPGTNALVYRLNGAAGQTFQFDGMPQTFNSNDGSSRVTLYGPDNAIRGGNYLVNHPDNTDFQVTLPYAGEYLLVLSGYDTSGSINYRFRATDVPAQGTPYTLGTVVTNTLNPGNGLVEYTFSGTAGQRLFLDALQQDGDTVGLALYAPGGAAVLGETDSDADRGPVTLPETGTYSLFARGRQPAAADYSFRLVDVAAQPALALNTTASGTLNGGLQAAAYRFTGTAGQRLYFDNRPAAFDGSDAGSRLSVYGPDNALRAGNYLVNHPDNTDLEFTLPTSGEYIVVASGGTTAGTFDYAFRALDLDASALPLTLGATVTATVNPGSSTLVYKFAGTAGQRLYLDALQQDGDSVNLRLLSPAGVAVIGDGDSDADRGVVQLPETGTYYLTARGRQNSQADFSFRLLDVAAAPVATVGTAVTGSLSPGLGATILRLPGRPAQRLAFDAIGTDTSGDWALYANDNRRLGGNNITVDFEATLPGAGDAVLVLSGSNRNAPVAYNFRVNDLTDAAVAHSGFGVDHAGPIAAGQVQTFNFTGSQGTWVYFDGYDVDNDAIKIDFRDAAGTLFSGSASSDFGPVALRRSGAHTLTIQGNGAGDTGDYGFRLIDLAANSTAITPGTVTTATLDPGTKAVVYRFSGNAGRKMYYDALQRDNDSVTASLLVPSGGYMWQIDSDQEGPFILGETGTYYLILTGNQTPPADYSFRLIDVASQPLATPGTPQTGTLDPGLQMAVYRLNLSAGQRLRFDSRPPAYDGSDASSRWTLYGPDGGNRASNYLINHPDNTDFEYQAPSTGEYTLVLTGGNAAAPVNFGFNVIDYDASSTPLTLGAVTTGTIDPGSGDAVYRFAGTAGQRLVLDALQNDPDAVSLRINGPAGNGLIELDADADRGPFTLTETGTYYVILRGRQNAPADYSFRLLDVATLPVVPFGGLVGGNLDGGLRAAVYRFSGTPGQRLFFDATPPAFNGNDASSRWNVYGPADQFLAGTYLVNHPDNTDFEMTVGAAGDYVVFAGGAFPATVPFAFRVLDLAANSTPLTLGALTTGSLPRGGETLAYRFTGTPGQRLYLDALERDPDSVYFRLVAPSGATIIGEGDSDSDRAPVTLGETGTYYLVARGRQSTPADFSFRLLDVAAQPAVLRDTAVTGSLSPGLTSSVYRLNGTAGQRLYFDNRSAFNAHDGSSRWNLYAPDGRPLGGAALVYQNGTTDFEVTLPASGEYTMVVAGENAAADVTYGFRITDLATGSTPLAAGATTQGVLTPGSATAVYRIAGTPGQRLVFDGLQRDSDAVSARLLDPNGAVVWHIDADADTGPFTLMMAGTYTLMLHGNEAAPSADYSFRLIDVASQALVTPGAEISGSINPGTGDVVYRVPATPGQRVLFESLAGDAGGQWALYSVDNRGVFSRGLTENVEVLFTGEGEYVLVLFGNNRNAPVNYRFRLTPL